MNELVEIGRQFEESEEYRRLMDRAGDEVHCIQVGYDRWYLNWILQMISFRFYGYDVYHRHQWGRWQRREDPDAFRAERLGEMGFPPDWDRHCRQMGIPEGAFGVKIIVVTTKPATTQELPVSFDMESVGTVAITYEARPPYRAYGISEGESIQNASSSTPGNSGGLFVDGLTGDEFLVGSGHVLGQVNDQIDYMGSAIGKTRRVVIPDAKAADPGGGDLDYGVASLLSKSSYSRVDHCALISQIASSAPATFVNSNGSIQQAEVRHYNLTTDLDVEYDGSTDTRVYKDCFEIVPRGVTYLNTDLATDGDSGAWVLHHDASSSLTDWFGLIVGGSGMSVVCCFSEKVTDDLNRHMSNLVLY